LILVAISAVVVRIKGVIGWTENITKQTKSSGNDTVENPWINLIACTTPSWIAGNFPEYMIGGGFTSRCVFVYAEEKRKYVAYPFLEILASDINLQEAKRKLVDDLKQIASLTGTYTLTTDGIKWGQKWYESMWDSKPPELDDARFGGYFARKQSHIHKLAMVITAAKTNKMVIEAEYLQLANTMVTELEADMVKVFSKIGKTSTSTHVDRLLDYVRKRTRVPYTEVYQFIHMHFPSARDFEDVMAGLINSGQLKLRNCEGKVVVEIVKGA